MKRTIQFNFNITSVRVMREMKSLVLFLMKLAMSNKNVTNRVRIVNGTGKAISPLKLHN
jgi:hypothetical protein